jgi:hypothetical protein
MLAWCVLASMVSDPTGVPIVSPSSAAATLSASVDLAFSIAAAAYITPI